jgi:hypothetical protein
MFDITIIFLALAVLTFLVLRRALGGRTRRQRPPQRISKPIETSAPTDRYAGIAIPGSPVAKGLDAIMAADGSFDVRHFIDGARAAYQMIVTAYTDGDRRTLTNLLAPEVYEGFEVAMRRREDAGERRPACCRSTPPTSRLPNYAAQRLRSRCASFRSCFRRPVIVTAPLSAETPITPRASPTFGFSPERPMYGSC